MKQLTILLLMIALLALPAKAQSVKDVNLVVQTYARGLDQPTGAAFVNDAGDLLVTQKNDGKVLLIRNKKIVGTALDLPVANDSERGLLSIALSPNFANDKFVYLYHTAATADGGAPISNKISRYRFDGSKLTFDRKIIDLPVLEGPNHDGGKITFDSKGKLYAVVGDLNAHERTTNFETSQTTRSLATIIRLQPNGGVVPTNPFATGAAKRTTQDNIFAYGIRNSFGLEIDPVTDRLWDTENGPDSFDEINQVSAGFNSGWRDIMGPKSRNGGKTGTLVNLGNSAFYADPKFSWVKTIAPTDLHFLRSTRLGSVYRNDLFVGDVNTGSLYRFDLNSTRRSLVLSGPLADLVADNTDQDPSAEQSSIIFGSDFGTVSDLLDGPGGLFALSLSQGKLYRITSRTLTITIGGTHSLGETRVPEPGAVAGFVIALLLWMLTRRCWQRRVCLRWSASAAAADAARAQPWRAAPCSSPPG
jgi:glucose/arabinose dehydrogenase